MKIQIEELVFHEHKPVNMLVCHHPESGCGIVISNVTSWYLARQYCFEQIQEMTEGIQPGTEDSATQRQ